MSQMGEYPPIPSALDRLDPNTSRNWIGLPSRAAGPTDTDIADECDRLRRENAALRRTIAALDERCIELTRAAEARDRGAIRATDPRGEA